MYRQTIHAFSLALADEVPEPELLPEADDPDRAGNAFSAAYADPAAALYTGEAIASPAMARKMEVDFIFRTVRGFYISGGGGLGQHLLWIYKSGGVNSMSRGKGLLP